MISKRLLLSLFALLVIIAGAFALADALGMYNEKGYTGISHGSHVHYVPANRDPDVSISRFPTTEPGPDEKITPTGQIVKKTENDE